MAEVYNSTHPGNYLDNVACVAQMKE